MHRDALMVESEKDARFLDQTATFIANISITIYNRQRYVNSRMEHAFVALHSKDMPNDICDVVDTQHDSFVATLRAKKSNGKIITEVFSYGVDFYSLKIVDVDGTKISLFEDAIKNAAAPPPVAVSNEAALEVGCYSQSLINAPGSGRIVQPQLDRHATGSACKRPAALRQNLNKPSAVHDILRSGRCR
jgi:hypothetical protein